MEILRQEELKDGMTLAVCKIDGLTVPVVVSDATVFTPDDWQQPWFTVEFSAKDIEDVEWRFGMYDNRAVVLDGLPRIFAGDPHEIAISYHVTVQDDIEPCNLFTTREDRFESTSYEEAKAVFNAEVVNLNDCLRHEDGLRYDPTDEENARGKYVSLLAVVEDEDPVTLEDSKRYFER